MIIFQERSINKAFTLAEVLITLLIIGMVASIVVPNLINDSQDAELKASWKKAYADLSQVILLIKNDNGGTLSGLCNQADFRDRNNCLLNIFKNYISTSKTCDAWTGTDNCFTDMSNVYINYMNSSAILSNGSQITLQYVYPNCQGDGAGPFCGHILIDTNGFKKPNKAGKDIFGTWIYINKLIPFGSASTFWGYDVMYPLDNCNPNIFKYDYSCSTKYLYQ